MNPTLTWPTPAQCTDAKREGKVVTITLPGGGVVTLASYVAGWKKVKQNIAQGMPTREIVGWNWFSVTSAEVQRAIVDGIHDRINRHLPWFNVIYRHNPDACSHGKKRLEKLQRLVAAGQLKCECRWCGSDLPHYETHPNRFCDRSCRQAYYS